MLAGCFLLCSCRDQGASAPVGGATHPRHPGALAQVGDAPITEEMFRREWARRHRSLAVSKEPTEAERAEVLEDLIRQETLWVRAQAEGFDRSPEMQARFKAMVVGAFREAQAKPPAAEVTEEELRAQYELQKPRLQRPAAVRAAVILVAVPRSASIEKRAAAKAKAESLAERALSADEAQFTDLARLHSDDQTTRFRGGELGWLTRESVGRDKELLDALLALPRPGGLSKVIETPVGFQVARLLEKRESGPRPFAEVRDQLHHQLQNSRRVGAEEAFHQSLKRGLAIEVDHSRLAALDLQVPASSPPSLPGGITSTTTP